MTNEEALDIMERQLECDNDNCPEPRTSCSECPYNVDAIDYARARKMAIEALSNRCASSEQAGTKPNQPEIGSIIAKTGENDEDRTTDDQCGDGARMIDLKKRTITERLIIANSLIASAIADSDNNQEVKKSNWIYRQATKHLDLFTKTYCRDNSIIDELVFRCSECEFEMPDGKCLVKCMARKICPDYKGFGSMGDL